MANYQFVQPVYYYFNVEAENIKEAYEKVQELHASDYYDEIVGDWEECTPTTNED